MAKAPPLRFTPRDTLKWSAVDFDGTLAEAVWTAEDPYRVGDPIWRNIHKVQARAEAGMSIVVYTARPWSDYEMIEAWLDYYCVPYTRIVCGKLLAAEYIDDRAINANDKEWKLPNVKKG